ncbi:hypothetical protein [Limnoglobus roseus]|uniref:Uncharacterized protein n=1 Tax=Limnoglobus roseus TaxID=2598579 RepID=A0A5C1AJH9_9BACT|nr:hypothetical protein [Limnoglobus roseus]QEL17862.1 hypothetical protein PX52LOC_04873 [Limnoglobus roseus]
MKRHTIHTDLFDLARFVDGIVQLWDDPEIAFALVEGKYADFGTLCLGDAADATGDTPLEWLHAGHTLFGQFARRDDDRYTLPGGEVLDVSDVGDEDDTLLDESSTYGFLVRVQGGQLRIESAVLQDSTGECLVTAVDDAGVFEEKMTAFVRSMVRKG